MRLKRYDVGDVRVVSCEGTMLLGAGAEELVDGFGRVLAEGRTGIVLDLTRLVYLDSAGVGSVVMCAKLAASAGVVMKISLASEGPVRRIFEITQLERGFEIFTTVEAAIASFA